MRIVQSVEGRTDLTHSRIQLPAKALTCDVRPRQLLNAHGQGGAPPREGLPAPEVA